VGGIICTLSGPQVLLLLLPKGELFEPRAGGPNSGGEGDDGGEVAEDVFQISSFSGGGGENGGKYPSSSDDDISLSSFGEVDVVVRWTVSMARTVVGSLEVRMLCTCNSGSDDDKDDDGNEGPPPKKRGDLLWCGCE
jgi:hypothetical protein